MHYKPAMLTQALKYSSLNMYNRMRTNFSLVAEIILDKFNKKSKNEQY